MPTLPSAADVIAITGTSLPETVVTALIQDAALVAANCISQYDGPRQTAIIKWLAAHMIASTAQGGESVLTSDKLGDASQTFARATLGAGLRGSMYGQQALALDPSGCLARKGNGTATVQVI